MEHLTPNTRTTPDRGLDRTLPPIQAIFAARFAAKKFGQRNHSLIGAAADTGLLTSLSQWNEKNPKPTISRSPQADRLQKSDIFSTSLNPKQNKAKPLSQRHIAQFRPKGLWLGLRPTAPEQNKPKPLRQPQIAQLRPKRLRINTSSPACITRTEQTQTPPSELQVKPKSIKKRIVIPTSCHQNRTNPSSATSRKLRNTNRWQSRNPPFSQHCATRTQQTQAPKPSSKAHEETY